MTSTRNPGRVAGLWYLLLSVFAPLRLIYIPSKVFVDGNAAATASNIAAHCIADNFRCDSWRDERCAADFSASASI